MTVHPDFDELLSGWLADDGPSDAPPRVAATAIAVVRGAPTIVGGPRAIRIRHASGRPVRLMAFAAAVALAGAAAALAFALLDPTPTPLPSVVELPRNGLIAIARHGDLVLIDPDTDEERTLPQVWPPDFDADPGFSPDGRLLTWWSHGWDDAVDRLRLTTLTPDAEVLEIETGAPTAIVAWAPSGDSMAVGVSEDGVYRLRFLDPSLRELRRADVDVELGGVDWRPDGRALVIRTLGPTSLTTLTTMAYPDGAPVTIAGQPAGAGPGENASDYLFARWSPDGRHIAYSSPESTRMVDGIGSQRVFVMDADGGGVRMLEWSRDARWEVPVGWSADGQRLLVWSSVADGASYVLLPVDGSPGRLITTVEGRGWNPVWSPDKARIAAWQSGTGDVVLVDVATGAQTAKDWEATNGLAWQPLPGE